MSYNEAESVLFFMRGKMFVDIAQNVNKILLQFVDFAKGGVDR